MSKGKPLSKFIIGLLLAILVCVSAALYIAFQSVDNPLPPPKPAVSTSESEASYFKIDDIDPFGHYSVTNAKDGTIYAGYIAGGKIRVAFFNGQKWSFLNVPGAGPFDPESSLAQPSIAVSPTGVLHIFSFDEKDKRLRHNIFANSEWTSEIIDGAKADDYGAESIAAKFDARGRLLVCYVDFKHNVLKLHTKESEDSKWQVKDLQCGSGRLYNCVNMEFNKAGNAVLSFADNSVYLGKVDGAWKYSLVAKVTDVDGGWPVLAIDSQDNPAIAYMTGAPDWNLMLARYTNGKWLESRINRKNEVVYSQYTIAAGDDGKVYVAYIGSVSDSFVLAAFDQATSSYTEFPGIHSSNSYTEIQQPSLTRGKDGKIHLLFSRKRLDQNTQEDNDKLGLFDAVLEEMPASSTISDKPQPTIWN